MPDPKGQLVTPVGFDAADDPRSLTVDADDNLNVNIDDQAGDVDVNIAAQDADVEIVQQNPADLRVGEHGYISAAWRKNPLLLGYSRVLAVELASTTLPAGNTTLYSDAVPAGEIWIITQFSFRYTGTSPTSVDLFAQPGGKSVRFLFQLNPLSGSHYMSNAYVILDASRLIGCQIKGATLNDAISAVLTGFIVDIGL